MKRMFGMFEALFDIIYLLTALFIGILLLTSATAGSPRMMAGYMTLVLAGGDAFHLVPRVTAIFTKKDDELRWALGIGKQITSITMTIFYLFLWQIGLMIFMPIYAKPYTVILYLLAIIRILLCLLPQNKWKQRHPPVSWGILRNIPFFMQGICVAILFWYYANSTTTMQWMWLAIILSFVFYLPVVLWSNRNAKIGMLMLPKTCAYLWMIGMCLSL